jgi:hypothetical protein
MGVYSQAESGSGAVKRYIFRTCVLLENYESRLYGGRNIGTVQSYCYKSVVRMPTQWTYLTVAHIPIREDYESVPRLSIIEKSKAQGHNPPNILPVGVSSYSPESATRFGSYERDLVSILYMNNHSLHSRREQKKASQRGNGEKN